VPSFESLDDNHAPAAAGARRTGIVGFFRRIDTGRRGDGQKRADAFEAGFATGAGKQVIMPDAMESTRQDVEQEPADELVGGERHDALPVGTVASVVLVAEDDAGLVEADQAAVRDGDAVGVARQIGEYGLGASEGRLGIDDQRFFRTGDRCRRNARLSAR
jgi:hypothetical protein